MKKYLLVTAAAAAALTLPAVASAQTTGYVDGGYARVDAGGVEADAFVASGAVVFDTGTNFQVQLDATGTFADGDNTSTIAAHGFYRNDTWALGAFVASNDVVIDTITSYGAEGAYYFPAVTLSGVVGKLDGDFVEATAYGAGLKFFGSDNMSFGINYTSLNPDGAGSNLDSWGVEAEYKFANPVSIFASYKDYNDIDTNLLKVGVRWNFGQDTLKSRDRTGASMGGAAATSLIF